MTQNAHRKKIVLSIALTVPSNQTDKTVRDIVRAAIRYAGKIIGATHVAVMIEKPSVPPGAIRNIRKLYK